MTSYEIYSHDFLSCPYCGKITNLYYAMVHINGKKCKRLQDLVTKETHTDLYLKFIREINRLKSSIKFENSEEDL